LPAGAHRIEWRYRPPAVLAGVAISVTAFLALAVLALQKAHIRLSFPRRGRRDGMGADNFCPDALYLKVTGKKPEDVFPALCCESSNA
jgi:hypothetical protein